LGDRGRAVRCGEPLEQGARCVAAWCVG
jgi:hypothetical protein